MAKSILPGTWQVPDSFHDRLGTSVGAQRAMVDQGHLLLVLHAPPAPSDLERDGRYFWRNPAGRWVSKELGSGVAALDKHLDSYEDLISTLDRQEQDASSASDYFEVLKRLSPVSRAAGNLHRVLQDARRLCPDYREIIDVRDRAYMIERSAELLFNGTKNALDVAIASRAEEQAQASERTAGAAHRLNILAALFFPIVTITAILGVDLQTLAAVTTLPPDDLATGSFPQLVLLGMILGGAALGGVLTLLINRPLARETRVR